MTNWTKIDEQQAESSWIGYEDFISVDGKLCKRVWYDGEEEIFKISQKPLDKAADLCYNKDN